MATDKQIAANRINALKSTGPITPQGKARCSENGIRHGMLARSIVLRSESLKNFRQVLSNLEDDHQPQNATEQTLVEILAVSKWRLRRLWDIERAGFDYECDQQTGEVADLQPPTRASIAFKGLSDSSRSLEMMNRYENRLDRQIKTTLDRLARLKLQRSRPTNVDTKGDNWDSGSQNAPPHAGPTPPPVHPLPSRDREGVVPVA